MSALLRNSVTPEQRRNEYLNKGFWSGDTLIARARSWPGDRVAVVDRNGARRRNYAELYGDVLKLAGYLREIGIGRGDVVSVQLPNEYEAVVAALAIQSVAAVINPILPNYRQKEIAYIFETANPKAIFTPAVYRGFDYRPMLRELNAKRAHSVRHIVVAADENGDEIYLSDILAGPGSAIANNFGGPAADAVSELIFTSGTEANPKAIMHTEQTANFSVRVAYDDLQMTPADVVWMPSPIGHSTGFNYGVRFALFHGLKLVLQDSWDARDAERLIRAENCSYTLAATTFLQDLVENLEASGQQLPFRCFGCGGAPVPAELVERALRVGIQVMRLYGSTEVLVASWNRVDSPLQKRKLSDGLPLSQVEMEIRDADGKVAERGEPGEIYVRGPNTSVGFFNDAERTAKTYDADGWVRSGDMAVMDDDGFISIVGRRKEIIIRGGLNIAPREIEDVLLSFPEVERAAVLPLADERLGERCCAAVVFRPQQQFDFKQMLSRLEQAGMAKYKWPERLISISAMPTTASGKIQKHRIVALLQSNKPQNSLLQKQGNGDSEEDFQLLSDSGIN